MTTDLKRIIHGLKTLGIVRWSYSPYQLLDVLESFLGHDKYGQTIIRLISCQYGIASLASCVSSENKHAPVLVGEARLGFARVG